MKSDEVFLRHILDELDFLLRRTGGISFDQFANDDVLRRACARSLDVDLGILWDVIQKRLLPLKAQIETLLPQQGDAPET